MKNIALFSLLITLASCNLEGNTVITNAKDYNAFLKVDAKKTTSRKYELWNSKIKPDSMQIVSFGMVAQEYNRYFKNTGKIEYLKKAEQCLARAVDVAAVNKADFYRSLGRNYISQHRFKEALEMALAAQKMGSGVAQTHSLLFDVYMELGEYKKAEENLLSLKDKNSFGYLIRIAKWKDYKGDLDATIVYMEKAKQLAEMSNNTNLKVWSYTNIADYYGHAGRIKDSYKYYLKSLELEPHNAYAKKGIAWIAFSYERNPTEALRILNAITKNYSTPDYYLLKAEIAEYQENKTEKLKNMDRYIKAVKNPAYGAMYNAYNVNFYLDYTDLYGKALEIAKEEISNRKTPESYMLLAHSFYKKGDVSNAVNIIKEHIEGKTFEPHILYNVAEIYKAAGDTEKVKELKTELTGAIYELGPNMEKKITSL
ncbi:tetratricopeptide repeat protein [Cellulophaga sp. RHA19]|uniref:tetratricopeptide repeat protein n=1 Tax=Cellulophaga sp. RHA19 TaxID=1798237 RepID=UPI000C2CDDB4|nr:tetratricopeptide repeat protein [Cellulophaga sp. RHA19]PKB44756.1 tetratricopeptide repeat protein [Cellulophaga sp. RHA19]